MEPQRRHRPGATGASYAQRTWDVPRAPESGTHLRGEGERFTDGESRPTRSREPSWHLRWRVAASPIPMLIFVRATGAIVAANDAAVRAYGWSHEELLESSISDLVGSTDGGVDRLLRVHHPRTTWTTPALQVRKDGTTFLAEMGMLEAGLTGSATMVLMMKLEDGPSS